MKRRHGDRRRRWQSTCQIEGIIMLGIAILLICAGGKAGLGLGALVAMFGLMDFRDAKRGWKMKDERPPWADKHDAIDAKWEGKK